MSNAEVVFREDSTQSICDGSPDSVDRALAPAVPASGAIRFSYHATARAMAARSASGLVALAMIFRISAWSLGPKAIIVRNLHAKPWQMTTRLIVGFGSDDAANWPAISEAANPAGVWPMETSATVVSKPNVAIRIG